MRYLFFIVLLISMSFSEITGEIRLLGDGVDTLSGKVTFYIQCELPGNVDPGSKDSLGISHVYLVFWNESTNYHFKSDILVGNTSLTKEKLENKILELRSITEVNLELLNEHITKTWKIQSLIFED